MNIFYLSHDPLEAAGFHCDKHVVKMILETAQLLSTAWHRSGQPLPTGRLYKPTHKNHPSAIWCRSSLATYTWTFRLGDALMAEYTSRYRKIHACDDVYETLSQPPELPDTPFTPPPFCGPADLAGPCVVQAYRRYYQRDKARIARWAHSQPPDWFGS